MSEDRPRRSGSNTTADRALQILGLFADDRLTITVADLQRELGMGRSSAYRYLQSLVREQFLESASDGSLRLGMRVLDLARLARQSYGVSDLALPLMKDLADDHRQTVLLTALIGGSVVCLERQEWYGQFVRLSYEPGVEMPVNAGASALALLAWRSEDELRSLLARPLQRLTPATLIDVDDLLGRLARIRELGYAVSEGEVDRDVLGIGVPIFDAGGEAVAALSIVALASRLDEAQRRRALDDLRVAAERVTARLRRAGV